MMSWLSPGRPCSWNFSCALCAVCYLLVLHKCLGLNYIYDEYMWTKDKWDLFKVDSPLQHMNPSEDALSRSEAIRTEIRGFKFNSLDGPTPRRKLAKVDSEVSGVDNIDVVEQLDHVAPAAKAAQCTVCHAFLTAVWEHVTHDVMSRGEVIPATAEAVREYEFLCEGEVPNLVLGKYTIHKLESVVSTTSMIFFVIRERKKGMVRTLAEIQAVEKACKALIDEHAKDFAVTLADNAKLYKSELDDVRKRLQGEHAPPSEFSRKLQSSKVTKQLAGALDFTDVNEDDEYADVDDDDDGEDDCEDTDPRCVMWAEAGECHRNSIYMVGDPNVKGHCRLACGMCTPRKPGTLPEPYKSEMVTVGKVLLMSLRNLACGSGRPCMTGVSGMAFSAGMVNNGEVKGLVSTPGFQLGKPYYGEADIRVFNTSEKARAAASKPQIQVPKDVSSQRAMAALVEALEGKVLAIPGPPDEYFLYEVAFRQWVQHYHEESDGSVTEAWNLGVFTSETYKAGELEMLDLLPKFNMQLKKWPYVRQVYSNGDECKLGEGKVATRGVEVRIACSPTASTHMLIREPDFCKYVIIIYTPALCSVPAYKPLPIGSKR